MIRTLLLVVFSGLLWFTPFAVSAASHCSTAFEGAVCQNTSTACAGTYIPGYCGGGFDTQCCVPRAGGVTGFFKEFAQGAGFPDAPREPEVIIGDIIKGSMVAIGVVFGILVIYGGYLWMTARGNEEIVKKAIGILRTAIIGFIITASAYAITNYVVERVIPAAYVGVP